jgi:hypothetical protein
MAETDAGVELITAIFAKLKADAAVIALMGDRLYSQAPGRQGIPENVPMPYLTLGPVVAQPFDADCSDGAEISVQLDIWSGGASTAFSKAEAMKCANAVQRALHDANLTLGENVLTVMRWELSRTLDDPDGVTTHAVVQFTAEIET